MAAPLLIAYSKEAQGCQLKAGRSYYFYFSYVAVALGVQHKKRAFVQQIRRAGQFYGPDKVRVD